jgi:uncharacterized protein YjiS (DUF1127 family)
MPLETIMLLPSTTPSRPWPCTPHPGPSSWRRALVGLRRLTSAMLSTYHAHRASQQLMACSDLVLRDMGVSRGEITRVVRHGRD